MEVWKDIKGYEGLYQVSDCGRIRSLNHPIKNLLTGGNSVRKGRIRTQQIISGYLYVALYKDGKCKMHRVNRLVAEAFIPNKEGKATVNHKDENKFNNCADNLEWLTRAENNNYGTHNKRIGKALSKPVYCAELDTVFESTSDAARKLGIVQSNISYCCLGKRKTAGGYHWQYYKGKA